MTRRHGCTGEYVGEHGDACGIDCGCGVNRGVQSVQGVIPVAALVAILADTAGMKRIEGAALLGYDPEDALTAIYVDDVLETLINVLRDRETSKELSRSFAERSVRNSTSEDDADDLAAVYCRAGEYEDRAEALHYMSNAIRDLLGRAAIVGDLRMAAVDMLRERRLIR